jgi:2-dehydro-3-deoxygluconokinase
MPQSCNIASIGECIVELSPEPGIGDAPVYRQGFAGDTLNTAWYLRALMPATCSVRYVTAVGDDAISSRMLAFMAENGIDISAIARLSGRSVGLYMIAVSAGERMFTYWRSQSAARALADDPNRLTRALVGCRLAYLSGITLSILSDDSRVTMLEVLARFRASGGLVAFDPNIRSVLWSDAATMRDWLTRGYATCDIAFPTFEDDAALFKDATPEDCARRISALGAFEVVVKNGGAPVLLDADGRQARIPPPRIVEPIDTTAAGDSFNAGWLAARLGGACATTAVNEGHALAARVIRHKGALIPMDQIRRSAVA